MRWHNRSVSIALDATYSLGSELSGVGIYSREILFGLATAHREERFGFCYRSHRLLRSLGLNLPRNCSRVLLMERRMVPRRFHFFHGLNQRMPSMRFRGSVCTFHDLFVLTGNYSSAEFRQRFEMQARDAAARADLIIAVSQFTADQVHSLLNVDRSRLRVIHHGIRPLPRLQRQREKLILTVGAIQTRKNTERLVEAFESVPEPWRLILAGSPAGHGAERVKARIAESPARARIHVAGYVTPHQLADLYARASLFAFPSLDEGFGMPVLEAMYSEVPVIASNSSALPEVCGDAAVFVNPLSAAELGQVLRKLAGNPEERQMLIERGRLRAAQFTWASAVERTWQVYRELPGY